MKQKDKQLFDAAKNGELKRARAAIEGGADIDARDQWQESPLHWAAACGHTAIAQLLIEKGADVNALDKSRKTPLDLDGKQYFLDLAASRAICGKE